MGQEGPVLARAFIFKQKGEEKMARYEELTTTEFVLVSKDGAYQYKLYVGTDGVLYMQKLVDGTWTEAQAINVE